MGPEPKQPPRAAGEPARRLGRRTLAAAFFALVLVGWLAYAASPLPAILEQRRTGFTFLADAFVWYPDDRVERISPGDGIYYQPSIRPDGSAVVYAGARSGPPRIWRADLADGSRTALTPEDSAALHPVYSWDGERIVYASDLASEHEPVGVHELKRGGRPARRQTFHIWVMDAAGGEPRQVTRGPHADFRPSFSPDGTEIVFVSNREGPDGLWIVPADGRDEPRPLLLGRRSYRPSYASDGAEIFFHSIGPDPHRLHRIAAGGGEPRLLENATFDRAHGAFAVPGTGTLLTHASRDGVFSIWEVPLDGGEPRRLQPPGFDEAYHATRSRDGRLAFDLPRGLGLRSELAYRLSEPLVQAQ